MMLSDFIDATTYANPTRTIPLATLFKQFRETLPEAERPSWFRQRFIVECVKCGLDVAVDNHRQTVIANRAFFPRGKRGRRLTVQDGRVLRVA